MSEALSKIADVLSGLSDAEVADILSRLGVAPGARPVAGEARRTSLPTPGATGGGIRSEIEWV